MPFQPQPPPGKGQEYAEHDCASQIKRNGWRWLNGCPRVVPGSELRLNCWGQNEQDCQRRVPSWRKSWWDMMTNCRGTVAADSVCHRSAEVMCPASFSLRRPNPHGHLALWKACEHVTDIPLNRNGFAVQIIRPKAKPLDGFSRDGYEQWMARNNPNIGEIAFFINREGQKHCTLNSFPLRLSRIVRQHLVFHQSAHHRLADLDASWCFGPFSRGKPLSSKLPRHERGSEQDSNKHRAALSNANMVLPTWYSRQSFHLL